MADSDPTISAVAAHILDEACDRKECLQALIAQKPSILFTTKDKPTLILRFGTSSFFCGYRFIAYKKVALLRRRLQKTRWRWASLYQIHLGGMEKFTKWGIRKEGGSTIEFFVGWVRSYLRACSSVRSAFPMSLRLFSACRITPHTPSVGGHEQRLQELNQVAESISLMGDCTAFLHFSRPSLLPSSCFVLFSTTHLLSSHTCRVTYAHPTKG